MIRRVFELSALTVAGGLLARWQWPLPGPVLLGALSGAVAWVLLDTVRGARVLRWLRKGEIAGAPEVPSIWGDVVVYARKSFKQLHRQVRQSEARLQEFLAALQASPNGVVLLDKSSAIEWCNFMAAQHLGFDSKRDLGQQIRHLVRDPAFIAYLAQEDFDQSVEIDGRRADPTHPQRISIHVHPYSKGRKLMLTRDITSIELAEAMRRDFVANVSHEIRTPLTVLSGFIETMQSLPLQEDERERYLHLMNQQAQRMQTLVRDLLTLSRLEGSPVPGTAEHVSSQELLEQVVADAQALSDVLVDLPHVIEGEAGPVFELAAARTELASAMSNLLTNAVRYTPAGGGIRAGWKLLPDGSAEFHVTDTGPGIDAEHLPRLTERFYRVDRSRSRETGGTGLGLAIVKHVAQRHGGQMQVESTLGKGSTFSITLPPSRVLTH